MSRTLPATKSDTLIGSSRTKIPQRLAVSMALAQAGRNRQSTTSDPSEDTDLLLAGYNISTNDAIGKSERFETDLHGNVNILLGGAMLSGVIIVVLLICYCCQKTIRKHRPREYSRYWRAEPDVHSLEVFTMDSQTRRHEASGAVTASQTQEDITQSSASCPCPISPVSPVSPISPGPPPAYESLIFDRQSLHSVGNENEKERAETSECVVPMPGTDRESIQSKTTNRRKDVEEELPSYEAALKLEAEGYV